MLLAYPFAYAIAFLVPRRWQRLALVMAILPFWTSYVVRSYAWLLALSPVGVVNQFLLALDLIERPLHLAYNPQATELGFVHFFIMLNALTIYANLVQINPHLRPGGAPISAPRPGADFLAVTLPLSLPGSPSAPFSPSCLHRRLRDAADPGRLPRAAVAPGRDDADPASARPAHGLGHVAGPDRWWWRSPIC